MEWISDEAAKEVASSEAHWAMKNTPFSVTYDDLFCAALEGIWIADTKYDPSRMANPEADFTAVARKRARWSMKDYLRSTDPLSRAHRKAIGAGEAYAPETVSWEAIQETHGTYVAHAVENRQLILKALGLLDDKERAVVENHVIDGLTAPETAKIVGCSVNNVYQIKRKAIQKMRRYA